MAKAKIVYQEKYKKGQVVMNNAETLRMLEENIKDIVATMRERTKYSDGTEEIVLSIRY